MITEEDFDAASDTSPDMAFVRLERKFRAAYEKNLENSDSSGSYNHFTVEYMNHVIAAAKALDLDILRNFLLPTLDEGDVYEQYKIFRQEVDHYTVQIQIAHIRSGPKSSIALDPTEKKHLRAYADAIKDIIDKSKLSPAKKERLFDKINAFTIELDKDRTPLQKFNDVVLSLANMGGEAAEELEPAWKWVKLGAAILGARQETEQTKLPSPPKRLELPKRQIAPPTKKDTLGDDIPF